MRRSRTNTNNEPGDEVAILGRVLGNGAELSVSLARHVLKLGFSDDDQARINDLATRNQTGELTARERSELRDFANAGCLLGVLHAKARGALKKAKSR